MTDQNPIEKLYKSQGIEINEFTKEKQLKLLILAFLNIDTKKNLYPKYDKDKRKWIYINEYDTFSEVLAEFIWNISPVIENYKISAILEQKEITKKEKELYEDLMFSIKNKNLTSEISENDIQRKLGALYYAWKENNDR